MENKALIFLWNHEKCRKQFWLSSYFLSSPDGDLKHVHKTEICLKSLEEIRNILSQSEKLDNMCFIPIETSFTKV